MSGLVWLFIVTPIAGVVIVLCFVVRYFIKIVLKVKKNNAKFNVVRGTW